MIDIEMYMNDGANWQAQAVLAYLRREREIIVDKTWNDKFHNYDAKLEVGRYENCREQGYVFTISYKNQFKHYAVYEHRNSDALDVLIAEGNSTNTPSIKFMWKDYNASNQSSDSEYYKSFEYAQICECGKFIVEDMQKFINNIIEKSAIEIKVGDRVRISSNQNDEIYVVESIGFGGRCGLKLSKNGDVVYADKLKLELA